MLIESVAMRNALYYGDCYAILKKYIKDETGHLLYLDLPFSSNRDYNVLFKEQTGAPAEAQVKSFSDTRKWSADLCVEWYQFVHTCPNLPVSHMQNFIRYLQDSKVATCATQARGGMQ